jgi:hypothetical protein
MIRLSLRRNQFIITLCRKSKSKECRMSGSFCMGTFASASWREATFQSRMHMQIHK